MINNVTKSSKWSKRISIIILILVNIIAVYGVLLNNLTSATLLLSYWAESFIFLIFVILKAKKVEKMGLYYNYPSRTKNYIIKSFAKSYIIILLFYLIFIIAIIFIPLGGTIPMSELVAKIKLSLNYSTLKSMLVLIIAFTISHTLSYKLNFIKNKEYKKATLYDVIKSPRQRIIIIHLAVVIGTLLRAPDLFLVGIKTLADIYGHIKERKEFGSIATYF